MALSGVHDQRLDCLRPDNLGKCYRKSSKRMLAISLAESIDHRIDAHCSHCVRVPDCGRFGYGTRSGIFLAGNFSDKFLSIVAKFLGIAVFIDSFLDPFNDNSALLVCVDPAQRVREDAHLQLANRLGRSQTHQCWQRRLRILRVALDADLQKNVLLF